MFIIISILVRSYVYILKIPESFHQYVYHVSDTIVLLTQHIPLLLPLHLLLNMLNYISVHFFGVWPSSSPFLRMKPICEWIPFINNINFGAKRFRTQTLRRIYHCSFNPKLPFLTNLFLWHLVWSRTVIFREFQKINVAFVFGAISFPRGNSIRREKENGTPNLS